MERIELPNGWMMDKEPSPLSDAARIKVHALYRPDGCSVGTIEAFEELPELIAALTPAVTPDAQALAREIWDKLFKQEGKYAVESCNSVKVEDIATIIQSTLSASAPRGLVEALEWYGENARLCRLIHSEGDVGRNALAKDGGAKARAALATHAMPGDTEQGDCARPIDKRLNEAYAKLDAATTAIVNAHAQFALLASMATWTKAKKNGKPYPVRRALMEEANAGCDFLRPLIPTYRMKAASGLAPAPAQHMGADDNGKEAA